MDTSDKRAKKDEFLRNKITASFLGYKLYTHQYQAHIKPGSAKGNVFETTENFTKIVVTMSVGV
jgi:hypothetical protein